MAVFQSNTERATGKPLVALLRMVSAWSLVSGLVVTFIGDWTNYLALRVLGFVIVFTGFLLLFVRIHYGRKNSDVGTTSIATNERPSDQI